MRRRFGQLVGSLVHSLVLVACSLLLIGQAAAGLLLAVLPVKPLYWLYRRFFAAREERRPAAAWHNVVDNQFTDARATRITSLAELLAAVNAARRDGRRLRAAGSGHSFSDVAVHDETMLDLHGMGRRLLLDHSLLRAGVDRRHLVEVESGMRIRELNRVLDDEQLALINMGGYDAQTISGAISTATHGSGHGLGALCDVVRSLVLVTEEGKTLRVEPTAGITDPAAHAARHPDGPGLVQDDALFHSVVVSMGCMGVVYSYILEVDDAYLLAETRELVPWDVLVGKLRAGDLRPIHRPDAGEIRHFEFLINPYRRRKGAPRDCLVTYRWKVQDGPRREHEKMRNPIATFITGVRKFDQVLARVITTFPRAARFLQGAALRSLVDDLYISKSYRVLNLGAANHVPAYSQELAFDAERRGAGDPDYLRAVELLLDLAEAQAEQGRYHSVPISVRFVKASPHYLAMSHGRVTAIVEIGMLAAAASGWELLRFYERRLFKEFRARPHWGQANFILGPDRVRAMYPDFDRWLASYARLCPRGLFDNSFAERLGLRTLAELHAQRHVDDLDALSAQVRK